MCSMKVIIAIAITYSIVIDWPVLNEKSIPRSGNLCNNVSLISIILGYYLIKVLSNQKKS